MPVRLWRKRVVGLPNAASSGTDEYRTAQSGAVRSHRDRGRTARVDRASSGARGLRSNQSRCRDTARANFLPVCLLAGRQLADGFGGVRSYLLLGRLDVLGWVGPIVVGLLRRAVTGTLLAAIANAEERLEAVGEGHGASKSSLRLSFTFDGRFAR